MVDEPTQVYDWKVGLWKTVKNAAVLYGIPFALYLIDNSASFIPKEQLKWFLPLTGLLSYFIKNFIENK